MREGVATAPNLDPLVVDLDQFHGPLDLLLHLIRKQHIDIFDIPIAGITAQFLEVIGDSEHLELERAGEFLELAATLVRIKAQLLFPRRGQDEVDDPRADLVRRLLEYEHFREAARTLEAAARVRSRIHPKGYLEARPRPSVADAPLETTWSEVWEAAVALANRVSEPEPIYQVSGRVLRIEDKMDHIVMVLNERARIDFAALIAPWDNRMHTVISLLACLELAKRSSLRLRQASPFASLWLYRSEEKWDAA
ncbi:MAG: chromosome segregation protein ScpA [Gemmatimonas sp.]|nr:chromosome segregation protein ScpA [Gemmatimonas sp.]